MFDEIAPESEVDSATMEAAEFPVATIALIAVLGFCFVIEVALPIVAAPRPASPDPLTLLALGGQIGQGGSRHWHRLLTSALLHGDAMHLVENCGALVLFGGYLEKYIGWRWTIIFFVAGTVGGSLASLYFLAPHSVGIGASGGIMGLIAAGVVFTWRFVPGEDRAKKLQALLATMLLSLLPLTSKRLGMQIDVAGHLGGALCGSGIALLVMTRWPSASSRAPRGVLLDVATVAVIVLVGFAVVRAAIAFPAELLGPGMVSKADFQSHEKSERKSDAARWLVQRYPRDPSSHLLLSFALLSQQPEWAEREARSSLELSQTSFMQAALDPVVTRDAHRALACALLHQGRYAQARDAARPLCGAANVAESVMRSGLCEEPASPPRDWTGWEGKIVETTTEESRSETKVGRVFILDGKMRIEWWTPCAPKNSPYETWIFDPGASRFLLGSPERATYKERDLTRESWFTSGAPAKCAVPQGQSCLRTHGFRKTREEAANGFAASVWEREWPQGHSVRIWRPDTGGIPLVRSVARWQKQIIQLDLTELLRASPAASLFEVPAGYAKAP